MANLFLIEKVQGNFENFNLMAKEAFESWNKEFPAPVLLENEINMIRGSLRDLLGLWRQLPAGNTIEILF